ncbi:hypothetical protein HYH03_007272 [Edaphochlamys debaryana]|uniref:PAS domain-containing protein n=1 Tax=Edaphochlamys debaryana TaxID=47281 RepID=A0A835Y3E9_9CHLO|nr:hypothetical protein HYH03_007272 [Edaphochlamys debaryana]|eukprot:KAG2494504.1 hypothetical protein HYH03_007272 [Edaphochlamys debaryana]
MAGSESNAGSSAASSASAASRRIRAGKADEDGRGEDLLDHRSNLENGIFGVLFTLSKEAGEQRVVIRWVLLKILLDGWQLFTTVIIPKMGWDIDPNGTAWDIIGVLNFQWLADLGYSVYLVVLYGMVSLLAINVGLCVWVAWCFKEQKFPVVWPIKVLRVFSSVFFQAFDVACLNLLQLGISCRYTGFMTPHMRLDLFPQYSCTSAPHLLHAIVSALSLILFVAIALLLNMAEVEVNPLSLRPMALGHSGAEVAAFGIKVLLTMTDVFLGWRRVCACANLGLSLGLAWVYLRRSPHLVAWPNHMKTGVSLAIVWCCACSVLLVFEPGVSTVQEWDDWRAVMTVVMLAGLGPAFLVGAALSWALLRHKTRSTLRALAKANPEVPLRQTYKSIDDPRDVEVVARCCRVWHEDYKLDPEAVNTAHQIIKAGLAMFPGSAFMVLLHANFMIDVLGVHQSGSRRIEDARKLSPSLMCRFIMFVRQQQATQKDAGNSANDGNSMDLLGYVEYQRKQRMVLRLHRDALQAMCNFWRALDSSTVSFTKLSKALGNIERSVSQAQTAYRVVLESYGSSPKLVRLYGKFLETIKNDPWGAAEYFAEADRLEETKNNDGKGPLLPDGTPLGRMDEMSMAVLVINSSGEVQMANKQTHTLFGYKRGTLEGKPLAILMAPHFSRRLATQLEALVAATGLLTVPGAATGPAGTGTAGADPTAGAEAGGAGRKAALDCVPASTVPKVDPHEGVDLVVVGMHLDRVAFPVKLSIRKASGVGEDSTFIALMEPLPPQRGQVSLWVAPNGTVAACDPQFVSNFGWRPTEVQGSAITAFMNVPLPERRRSIGLDEHLDSLDVEDAWGAGLLVEHDQETASNVMKRLLAQARADMSTGMHRPTNEHAGGKPMGGRQGVEGLMKHKYDASPCPVTITVLPGATHSQHDLPMHELRLRLVNPNPPQLLVASRKGVILHASPELAAALKDTAGAGGRKTGGGVDGGVSGGMGPLGQQTGAAGHTGTGGGGSAADQLSGFTLQDFLPSPWKDTHAKLLKDITALSPPGRTPFSCRKGLMPGGGTVGPTLELRTVSGKPLYMAVAVTTNDMGGEPTHVVRMAKSSMDVALAERRVYMTVSADGRITSISKGPATAVIGLKRSEVLGRGLWELISADAGELESGGSPPASGPLMLTALVERALAQPGRSWRVSVSAPAEQGSDSSGVLGLSVVAAARAAKSSAAVMVVRLPTVEEVEAEAAAASMRANASPTPRKAMAAVVELWPTTSVMGLLQLDAEGRVAAVLEEHTRPAGLLFGLPSGNLLGEPLRSLVTLPAGCTKPSDLLSNRAAKKSSLKTNRKDQPLKVGPVHVLQALHADGRPVSLDVQADATSSGAGDAAEAPAAPDVPVSPAALASKGKLADLVKSIDIGRLNTSVGGRNRPERTRRGSVALDGKAAEGGAAKDAEAAEVDGTKASAAEDAEAAVAAEPRVRLPGSVHGSEGKGDGDADSDLDAVLDELSRHGAKVKAAAVSTHSTSADEAGSGSGSHEEVRKNSEGAQNVKKWVESEGAFYANTVPIKSSDEPASAHMSDADSDGAVLLVPVAHVATKERAFSLAPTEGKLGLLTSGNLRPGKEGAALSVGGESRPATRQAPPAIEDDAASEGGQSAMSGMSAASIGAEYKRGKRFRKLARLMDSSQAQTAQQRLRRHGLIVVALMAAVHVVCFVLVVLAFEDQRAAMLAIGYSGESQRFMHQILADTRSLDVITRNMTHSNLYTAADAPFFLDRIARGAEEIKVRFNEILTDQHKPDSVVVNLLYNTTRSVWSGNNPDGTDVYMNITVWDFSTRFYSMARLVAQHGAEWIADGTIVSSTGPGQFLLKSGGDLFRASRLILDALLYQAVDAAKAVSSLQLILLGVEGAAMSCLAALYLAYLLKAVAAQRYKLYGTFLVIPVGLTRALASQNTNLLVGDEDDDEDADEEEQQLPENASDQGEAVPVKQKRRATLAVEEPGKKGGDRGSAHGELEVASRTGSSATTGRGSMRRRMNSQMLGDPAADSGRDGGTGVLAGIKRLFSR